MKRIALIAAFAMLTAGSFAMGGAEAAYRSPYAAAQRGPYDSATRPDEQAPPPSIPYDAGGPAYLPGQNKTTDFQLQH